MKEHLSLTEGEMNDKVQAHRVRVKEFEVLVYELESQLKQKA